MAGSSELSIYIAMRRDLNMRRGKEIAQAVHAFASLGAEDRGPVIGVRAESEADLRAMIAEAEAAGVGCAPVVDAARTEFSAPTLTCAAFGPVEKGRLHLLTAARTY